MKYKVTEQVPGYALRIRSEIKLECTLRFVVRVVRALLILFRLE